MHDSSTLQMDIQPPHGNFHASDFLAITLAFLPTLLAITLAFLPTLFTITLAFLPTLFTILNENSGVFVSLAALFGASFTTYRFITVYTDRRKTHKKRARVK